MRCQNQNCERSFHGVAIPALPPLVPGEEAYYCSWGFFPMGFVFESLGSGGKGNWAAPPHAEVSDWMPQPVAAVDVPDGAAPRKRGRPRRV